MTEADFQELYVLIRGAKFASTILDANAAFGEREYSVAIQHVRDVRGQYAKAHMRTLRADPIGKGGSKDAARLQRKQEKHQHVLNKLDEMLVDLRRMSDRWGNKERGPEAKPRAVGTPRPIRDTKPQKGTASADTRAGDEQPSDKNPAEQVLDIGAFTQLMDAAQRSRLVAGAERIGHIRDREFRMEKFQEASQLIENMFGKFIAAATRRTQTLRQEELDIASGRLKLSPKDLQAKRARETAETQAIERARNRFTRVLEGLRILIRR